VVGIVLVAGTKLFQRSVARTALRSAPTDSPPTSKKARVKCQDVKTPKHKLNWDSLMQRIISTAARGPIGRRASLGVRHKSSSLQANLGRRFEAQHKQLRRSFSDVTKRDSELANTSKDGVVGFPLDFDVQSKVEGSESQIVTISLKPGQVLRAESGAMMYMTDGVEMNTTTG
jgi:hypothetical protein